MCRPGISLDEVENCSLVIRIAEQFGVDPNLMMVNLDLNQLKRAARTVRMTFLKQPVPRPTKAALMLFARLPLELIRRHRMQTDRCRNGSSCLQRARVIVLR